MSERLKQLCLLRLAKAGYLVKKDSDVSLGPAGLVSVDGEMYQVTDTSVRKLDLGGAR